MKLTVLVALCACSDPGFPCPDYKFAHVGSACGTPAITIDGDFGDWEPLHFNSSDCTVCGPGQVRRMKAVRTADSLAVYVDTNGAPIVDAMYAYSVFLYANQLPTSSMTFQFQPGTATIGAINDFGVVGLPSSIAYGDTGFEVAIPFAVLPFEGGVVVGAQRDVLDMGQWTYGQDQLPFSQICWDPTSPGCAI